MVSQRLINEGILIHEDGVRVAAKAIQDAVDLGFVDTEREIGRVLNQAWRGTDQPHGNDNHCHALTFHSTIAGFRTTGDEQRLMPDRRRIPVGTCSIPPAMATPASHPILLTLLTSRPSLAVRSPLFFP